MPDGPAFGLLHAWSFLHRPKQFYRTLRHRFGDVVTIRPPQGPLVLALSSEGARQVFSASPDGLRAYPTKAFSGLIGDASLWVLGGERHRAERRLLSPPFHAACLRHYSRSIQETVLLYIQKWQPGQTIRAYDVMSRVSGDVILGSVLGIENGPMLEEGHQQLANIMRAANPWICFIAECQSWWFPPWVRFQRASREFVTFLMRCVEQRRTRPTGTHDVLSTMLTARSADGAAMRDEDIQDELVTMLVSGHDTAATAMAWALYELGRSPDILSRLREELRAIEQNPDALARQPYLDAVCHETLRRRLILSEVARTTVAPLEVSGWTLPPGTGVGVSICSIHQDPLLYPDPERFVPERFINRTYSPFEFLPFGGGDRRCLGSAFAEYEMRIALATVVARWDFESVGEDQEVRHNVSMGPKHGIRMRLKRRIA